MNVCRMLLQSLPHDLIHKLDDGSFGIVLVQNVDFLFQVLESVVNLAAFQDLIERFRAYPVPLPQAQQNSTPGR